MRLLFSVLDRFGCDFQSALPVEILPVFPQQLT
jgi:hypothetical protein